MPSPSKKEKGTSPRRSKRESSSIHQIKKTEPEEKNPFGKKPAGKKNKRKRRRRRGG